MIAKLKSLKNHQGFLKYFKNTSWLFGEKIFRMIVGLLVGIWVARYLGPERFGVLRYSQSFVALFTSIATLGLNAIVVRELVKYKNKRDELLGTSFILQFFGALFVLILLSIVSYFTSNDNNTNTLVFIIASATIFQSFNVIDFYFQSKVLSKYVVFANVMSLFISSIIKVFLILNDASLMAFVWVILFDSIILAFGFIYFYVKKYNKKISKWKFKKSLAFSLLKDSWPLILTGIAISINLNIDKVMINELLGSRYVGLYAAAISIATVFGMIPHMITQSIFPSFVNVYQKNNELFLLRIKKGYKTLFYISLVFAIFVILFSKYLILTTYGNEYSESIQLLNFMIISILFNSIGAINSLYFKVKNMQKKMMNRQWINVILNVLLNYFLIQKFGVSGAVYATIIATLVSAVIYDLFDKECREINQAKLEIFNFKN
ncbi:flippase [Flavobacteriaceae bacterium]|nr:flippase [Flavobacteriaceae bacterium]